MIHLYVGSHAAPAGAPGALQSLATVVSPTELDRETVERALAGVQPTAITRVRRFALLYPETLFDSRTALHALQDAYRNCERCHLADRRNFITFYRGNPNAAILAVGGGSDADDDLKGVPFGGSSGKLQDELFREAGIDPERDVCWANLVGCRPMSRRLLNDDRAPTAVETIACSERFLLILRAVRPRIVLCLGDAAATAFYPQDAIPEANTFATFAPPPGASHSEPVTVGVFQHPDYLLRIGQQPNMYGAWAGQRLALRQVRAWLPATKLPAWSWGLRYVSDLTTMMVGT